MLPETGEVILQWLPYVDAGLIVLVLLLLKLERKDNKK